MKKCRQERLIDKLEELDAEYNENKQRVIDIGDYLSTLALCEISKRQDEIHLKKCEIQNKLIKY